MKILLTSDWHLRMDIPICRKDDFLVIQHKALLNIAKVAYINNAPILHAGDFFNTPRPYKSQELENMVYDIFKDVNIYMIPGNHCLLYHSLGNINKSSLGVISKYSNINLFTDYKIVNEFGFDLFLYKFGLEYVPYSIAMFHNFCSEGDLPFFMRNKRAVEADEILKSNFINEFGTINLIVTGDNHNAFVKKYKEKVLINPGCITRQNVDKKDYLPVVYLFDTNTKEIVKILLNDSDPSAIDDSNLNFERLQFDNSDLEGYTEDLKTNNIDLDIRKKLLDRLDKDININEKVKEKILMAMEEN